jgi:L-malate glycosyltransferase
MTRKLRIASLYRTLRTGGDERRLLHFARGLDRSRFEFVLVVVFPPDPDDDDEGPILSEFLEAGVEVVHLEDDPGRWVRPWLRPAILRAGGDLLARLVRLLRERRVDVVDARLAAAIPMGIVAARLAGVPVVVGAQYNFYTWQKWTRRALSQVFWPWLDALVCDSQLRLDEMRASLWFPPRGAMIDNGIFPPESRRSVEDIRRQLDLPLSPRVKIVGQVATLLRFKGYAVLLEAAASVIAREPDTAFLFCGFPREPGFRDELCARAKELGIEDRVRITGYDGPIGDVWKIIDVHAHASLYDSAPQTIVESMSLAKPAVVTSAGGIPEMIEPGVTAIMVPPGEPGPLADAIVRLLQDPEEARRLGEGARLRYERVYRAEIMVEAIVKLFADLLAGKTGERIAQPA